MSHRIFKQRIYPQFARVAQALASDKRLELVDLLAQAPRHVDALAEETEMSVANVSQHLQVLRGARLVETTREGTKVVYRLADDSVLHLWLALRSVAESRLAEVGEIAREFMPGRKEANGVDHDELERLLATGEACVIDVRPRQEFEHGHLAGAVSIPLDDLPGRLDDLPRDRLIVTYCRGEYCLFADEAVQLLRERGFRVARLEGGWPEWSAEGRPIVQPTVIQGARL
jgi:rhodanese-related sulfurtransferase